MNKKIKLILMLVLPLLHMACAKAPQSSLSSKATAGATNGSAQTMDTKTFLGCASQDASVGRLIDPAYNTSNADIKFTQVVKDFASSFMDTNKIGNVSGSPTSSTGIEIEGAIYFDKNGQALAKNSRLQLEIFDDQVGKISATGSIIKSIPVYLNTLKSGQWNRSTGRFEAVFEDKFGEVVLRGVISKTSTSAEVKFINKTEFSGGSAKSGTLESFYIYSCGFIY